MIKPNWVDRILHFFCKLFKKDEEEMSNKLKKELCEKALKDHMCNENCYCCAWKIDEEVDKNP